MSTFDDYDDGYESSYEDYEIHLSDIDRGFVWDGTKPSKNKNKNPSSNSKLPAKTSFDNDDSGSWYTIDYDDEAWQSPKKSDKGKHDRNWNRPAKKTESRKKFSVKDLKRKVEDFSRSRFSADKNRDRFEKWDDEDFKNQNNGKGRSFFSIKKIFFYSFYLNLNLLKNFIYLCRHIYNF